MNLTEWDEGEPWQDHEQVWPTRCVSSNHPFKQLGPETCSGHFMSDGQLYQCCFWWPSVGQFDSVILIKHLRPSPQKVPNVCHWWSCLPCLPILTIVTSSVVCTQGACVAFPCSLLWKILFCSQSVMNCQSASTKTLSMTSSCPNTSCICFASKPSVNRQTIRLGSQMFIHVDFVLDLIFLNHNNTSFGLDALTCAGICGVHAPLSINTLLSCDTSTALCAWQQGEFWC